MLFKYMLLLNVGLSTSHLIGEYVPQVDELNNLLPRQCWASTGTCWCAFAAEKKYFRLSDHVDCPNDPHAEKHHLRKLLKNIKRRSPSPFGTE